MEFEIDREVRNFYSVFNDRSQFDATCLVELAPCAYRDRRVVRPWKMQGSIYVYDDPFMSVEHAFAATNRSYDFYDYTWYSPAQCRSTADVLSVMYSKVEASKTEDDLAQALFHRRTPHYSEQLIWDKKPLLSFIERIAQHMGLSADDPGGVWVIGL